MRAPTRRDVLRAGAAVPLLTLAPYAVAAAPTLAPAAMATDVRLLARAYETLHPGLYRYQTPAEWRARVDALIARCAQPLGQADFYVALSRFLHGVRCGHSYANFYNQQRSVQQALFDGGGRLPLSFLWLGARMIVTADPFGTGIAPGTEVVAIDGRPAGEILAALLPVARADGHNDAKRRRLMSVQGEDGYESFDVFFPLIFGAGDRFALTLRDPAGRTRRTIVAGITLAQRRTQRAVPDRTSDAPIWTMARRGDAAVLTMNSWGLYDSKWDWQRWLDAEVSKLVADGVRGLVVDIRRNEGGIDAGDALIARLTPRPIVPDDARRLVRFRTLPADLRPYCDTWDRSFDRLGEKAAPYDDRYVELTTGGGADTIAPTGPRFAGKVAVLTGPQNSSATFTFARALQAARLATLVGEETGGNRRGINGGSFYFFRLPETGLEVDLPLVGTFPRTPQPDAGVRPDRAVPLTAAAIAGGTDPAMAAALRLVG